MNMDTGWLNEIFYVLEFFQKIYGLNFLITLIELVVGNETFLHRRFYIWNYFQFDDHFNEPYFRFCRR